MFVDRVRVNLRAGNGGAGVVSFVRAKGKPKGKPVVAFDSVGAGVREKVLIVMEGRAAGEALGRKGAPVDAAIVGIVDSVDVQE